MTIPLRRSIEGLGPFCFIPPREGKVIGNLLAGCLPHAHDEPSIVLGAVVVALRAPYFKCLYIEHAAQRDKESDAVIVELVEGVITIARTLLSIELGALH